MPATLDTPALSAQGADLPPQQATAGPMSPQAEAISHAAANSQQPQQIAARPVPPDHPVTVYAPNGTLGRIPATQLKAALAQGAKLAYPIIAPDGTAGYIAAKDYNAAIKQGAKPADSTPVAEARAKGFWRSAYDQTLAMIPSLYHAAIEAPRNDEEEGIELANGRTGLLAYRVAIAPIEQQVHEAMDSSRSPVERAGHALAAVTPIVGPWAASVAETAGQQAGAGNLAGAAGTAAGFGAMILAPKAIGKGTDIVAAKYPDFYGKMAEMRRNMLQEAVGIRAKGARDLVAETVDKAEQTAQKAAKLTKRLEDKNEADANKLLERTQKEQELAQATQQYYDLEDTTRTKAHDEMRAAWQPWDEKMANATVDGGEIAGALENIVKTSPETARVLRQLTPSPEDAAPDSLYAQDRAAIMKSQGYEGSYWDQSPEVRAKIDQIASSNGLEPEPIDFDPKAGEKISVRAVQRAKSIIGRNIASGRYEGYLLGEMKQLYGVLDRTVKRASADAGALEDYTNANEVTKKYMKAFGRVRHTPITADEAREKLANPEAYKEREDQERLEAARAHNPELVDAHNHVRALRDELKKMPSGDKLRNTIEARRERIPPSPDAKTAEEIMHEQVLRNSGIYSKFLNTMRSRGIWWTAVLPWLYVAHDLIAMRMEAAGIAAIHTAVVSVGIVTIASKILEGLEEPKIADWFAHPPEAQIQVLEKLSPGVRQYVAEGFKNVDKVASQHGYKVSPLIKAFVAQNAAASASHYTHTARNAAGHRIGTNDGGKTWHDIATGQQTHAAASQQP